MNAVSKSPSQLLMKMCRKCGNTFPADLRHFYKNTGGKFGVTPRCKACVNEDNKNGHANRLKSDPERVRLLANERSKRHYNKDLEKSRERQRAFQAKRRSCPKTRLAINMAKRAGGAGLTAEMFDHMFASQNYKCAICESDKPFSKAGWNVDHCHKTNEVRFILCAHCNRGLGAFRDKPDLMRKAAKVLEAYQNQSAGPQKAILEGNS